MKEVQSTVVSDPDDASLIGEHRLDQVSTQSFTSRKTDHGIVAEAIDAFRRRYP